MKRLDISAIPSTAQKSKQFEIALRTYTACQAKIVRKLYVFFLLVFRYCVRMLHDGSPKVVCTVDAILYDIQITDMNRPQSGVCSASLTYHSSLFLPSSTLYALQSHPSSYPSPPPSSHLLSLIPLLSIPYPYPHCSWKANPGYLSSGPVVWRIRYCPLSP